MKLIVCDLDGTLLFKGEEKIKKDILESVENLRKKNVMFACASGRTYGELRRIFDNENIIYIPFNGGGAYFENKTLVEFPVSNLGMKNFENTEDVVFHSKLLSYIKSEDKRFLRDNFQRYNGHIQKISDITEVKEPVLKITAAQNSDAAKKSKGIKRIYDGREFVDFASENADKGTAVEKLCEMFEISFENLFVIGDNLNDISMMSLTKNSFSVYGAKYQVRKAAKNEISSAEAFLRDFDV